MWFLRNQHGNLEAGKRERMIWYGRHHRTGIWTEEPVHDPVTGLVDPNTAQYVVTAVAHGIYHMKYAIKRQAGR